MSMEEGKRKRRPRRSPEELLKELESKKRRLEGRLYKKNHDGVFVIGQIVLQEAGFEFTNLTGDIIEKLQDDADFAKDYIRPILEKALDNL
jgi:hypothetical protein